MLFEVLAMCADIGPMSAKGGLDSTKYGRCWPMLAQTKFEGDCHVRECSEAPHVSAAFDATGFATFARSRDSVRFVSACCLGASPTDLAPVHRVPLSNVMRGPMEKWPPAPTQLRTLAAPCAVQGRPPWSALYINQEHPAQTYPRQRVLPAPPGSSAPPAQGALPPCPVADISEEQNAEVALLAKNAGCAWGGRRVGELRSDADVGARL